MKRAIFLIAAAAVVIAAGCASGRRGEPFTRDPRLGDPQLVLGQRAFYRNCNACHPAAAGGYGPSLADQFLPGWYIRLRVRQGLGAMPPFDENRLSQAELDAIVRYIHALNAI